LARSLLQEEEALHVFSTLTIAGNCHLDYLKQGTSDASGCSILLSPGLLRPVGFVIFPAFEQNSPERSAHITLAPAFHKLV
jgi:hypothetical protein